jgi:hypothetical protein
MTKKDYKFKIQHLVGELPKKLDVRSELEKIGIAPRTFQRDKAILITDDTDIPSERLLKYAQFFGVSIEELFNKKAAVKKNPVIRTGLKAILLAAIVYTLSSCSNYTCPTYSGARTNYPYHSKR